MPLLLGPHEYLCKIRFRLIGDDEEMISTIGVRPKEEAPRDPAEVAEAVYNAWLGAWEPQNMSNEWALVGCDVLEGPLNGTGRVGSYNKFDGGTANAATLPQNCAILIRKQTTAAGRRNVGRMYIPSGYLGESSVNAHGVLSGPLLNALQSFATQFLANLTDESTLPGDVPTNFNPVLFHGPRKAGGQDTSHIITGLGVDSKIATQRRRLRS
jgi:hypothetical protein